MASPYEDYKAHQNMLYDAARRHGLDVVSYGHGPVVEAEDVGEVILELDKEIARLRQERDALREAGGSVIWLHNNMHNYGSDGWRDFFEAAVDDVKKAMGDELEGTDD